VADEDFGSVELILASGSPRRQELLANLGLSFRVLPSNIDESTSLTDPLEIVSWLSLSKAQEVASRLEQSSEGGRRLILGADTIVVLGKHILGKPQDSEEAYSMLMLLSGQEHRVFTGVTVLELPSGRTRSISLSSSIFFRKLDEQEARFYAGSGEPMDKAGAYALQGAASAFIDRVEGCYTNVIGLPVSATVQLLREFGMQVMGSACGAVPEAVVKPSN
jgi:septum formation protein